MHRASLTLALFFRNRDINITRAIKMCDRTRLCAPGQSWHSPPPPSTDYPSLYSTIVAPDILKPMNPTEPTRKRSRADAEGPSLTSIRRSKNVYYPDGNIVLMTSVPNDKHPELYQSISHDEDIDLLSCEASLAIVYRVHTSILASHCGFFSSLFGGSQAAFDAASENYDGCPLMELPGDDWRGVDDFLKAMYIPQ